MYKRGDLISYRGYKNIWSPKLIVVKKVRIHLDRPIYTILHGDEKKHVTLRYFEKRNCYLYTDIFR